MQEKIVKSKIWIKKWSKRQEIKLADFRKKIIFLDDLTIQDSL